MLFTLRAFIWMSTLLKLPRISRPNLGKWGWADKALRQTFSAVLPWITLHSTREPGPTNQPDSPSEAVRPSHRLQSEVLNLNKQMSVGGSQVPGEMPCVRPEVCLRAGHRMVAEWMLDVSPQSFSLLTEFSLSPGAVRSQEGTKKARKTKYTLATGLSDFVQRAGGFPTDLTTDSRGCTLRPTLLPCLPPNPVLQLQPDFWVWIV